MKASEIEALLATLKPGDRAVVSFESRFSTQTHAYATVDRVTPTLIYTDKCTRKWNRKTGALVPRANGRLRLLPLTAETRDCVTRSAAFEKLSAATHTLDRLMRDQRLLRDVPTDAVVEAAELLTTCVARLTRANTPKT